MQTITFYAYKGGTGRSLVLANAAKYLARLGQRVVALDLDLEAPGLHYKLILDDPRDATPVEQGIVDCIHHFHQHCEFPESLASYAVNVVTGDGKDGNITLIPAGNIRSAQYWKKLAQIDWHNFFFSTDAPGIPFFLELKSRIQSEFFPDFLLIDARTGITEVGGVATTLLPDQVVCLVLNNRENLEGAREVLRGIGHCPRLPNQKPIEVITVLSRIPQMRGRLPGGHEDSLVEGVRSFLVEDGDEGLVKAANDILILHSEEMLQIHEALRIGGDRTVDESPLLRDYLRLFSRLIPREMVEPHLDSLIHTAMERMLDSPDRTQNDLEALAAYCPHPASYLALLKYYILRNAGSPKILRAAARYWELSRDSSNPLLWDAIKAHFKVGSAENARERTSALEFVEAVWNEWGASDAEVGLRIASIYYSVRDPGKGTDVVGRLLANAGADEGVIVACLSKLIESEQWVQSAEVIDRYKSLLSSNPDFQAAWASVIIRQNNAEEAKSLIGSKDFRPAILQTTRPALYARLLRAAGSKDELNAMLRSLIDPALASRDESEIFELARLAAEVGRQDLFTERVKELLPPMRAERLLNSLPFSKDPAASWRP